MPSMYPTIPWLPLPQGLQRLKVQCLDGSTSCPLLLLAASCPLLLPVLQEAPATTLLLLPQEPLDRVTSLLQLISTGEVKVKKMWEVEELVQLSRRFGVERIEMVGTELLFLKKEEQALSETVQSVKEVFMETLVPVEENHLKNAIQDQVFTNELFVKKIVNKSVIPRIYKKKTKCHQCPKCFKLFYSNAQLQAHEAKHDGTPGFFCDHCGKAFYRKDRLTIHVRDVHNGFKNFDCEKCDKKFSDRYKLKRHMKTHSAKEVHTGIHRKKLAALSILKLDFVEAS